MMAGHFMRREKVQRKVQATVRKVMRELCPSVRSCLQTTAAIVALVFQVKGLVGLNGGDIESKLREISERHGMPLDVVKAAFYRGCEIYEREISNKSK
jgi:signal transduction histidine kinase